MLLSYYYYQISRHHHLAIKAKVFHQAIHRRVILPVFTIIILPCRKDRRRHQLITITAVIIITVLRINRRQVSRRQVSRLQASFLKRATPLHSGLS